MKLLKPPRLQPGDTVAIVTPADRPRSPGELERATALVSELGFVPRVYSSPTSRISAWNGTDEARAALFMEAWCQEEVRAVWLLRGGWGAARLLPLLDYQTLAAHPKILIAHGEASGLLVAIHQRTQLVTVHGPELARCKLNSFTRSWLLRLLTRLETPGAVPFPHHEACDHTQTPLAFVAGTAEGELLGGDLTEIASLLGTPDTPRATGKLLFLSLPHAPPYVLERHLTALRLAGIARHSTGIVLSDYPGNADAQTAVTLTLEEALRYGLHNLTIPIYSGLPIGQREDTIALPLGIRASIDPATKTLVLNEAMVST